MSPKSPPALAPPAASVGKGPPPAKTSASPVGVTLRVLLTCLLLALCFATFNGKTLFELIHELAPGLPAGLLALVLTSLAALVLVFLWRVVITIDSRFQAPLLITYIIAVGHATYGILENHYSPLLDEITRGWITSYSPASAFSSSRRNSGPTFCAQSCPSPRNTRFASRVGTSGTPPIWALRSCCFWPEIPLPV